MKNTADDNANGMVEQDMQTDDNRRCAVVKRKTGETDICVKLCLDGEGKYDIDSGCGFFNHMAELFTRHGNFNLTIKCKGDVEVDYHHSIEDIGICLGTAFADALGDKKGICRYGSVIIPMDEALILTAVDISGRGYVNFDVNITCPRIGDFDTELVAEFLNAFVRSSGVTVHIKQFYGKNLHHIIEGVFKSLARALRAAVSVDSNSPDTIPSTKGIL